MGLRQLRQERDLSIEAVAVLAGIDKATISRIERGVTQAHPATIVKLARGLGIGARRMREILADVETDEPNTAA